MGHSDHHGVGGTTGIITVNGAPLRCSVPFLTDGHVLSCTQGSSIVLQNCAGVRSTSLSSQWPGLCSASSRDSPTWTCVPSPSSSSNGRQGHCCRMVVSPALRIIVPDAGQCVGLWDAWASILASRDHLQLASCLSDPAFCVGLSGPLPGLLVLEVV